MNTQSRTVSELINRIGNNPAYITGRNLQQFAPFALFDAGRLPNHDPLVIDWHPHSGVATITFPYGTELHHADSAGNKGIIGDQGLQWMASGKGVWHKESYFPKNNVHNEKVGIMQLWLMLNPEEETAEVNYFNLQTGDIPQLQDHSGNITRVLLGEYLGTKAAQKISHNASYLDVHLKAGDSWSVKPSPKQIRGFVYPRMGSITISDTGVESQQLALLEENENELIVNANEDTQFVVALTEPWVHPIVRHYGQIHTSQAAMKIGSEHIQKLKKELMIQLETEQSDNLAADA